jgi:hypothetical protein
VDEVVEKERGERVEKECNAKEEEEEDDGGGGMVGTLYGWMNGT